MHGHHAPANIYGETIKGEFCNEIIKAAIKKLTITKQSVFSSLKQDCMHCLTLSYAFIINSLSHAQITFIYYCMFIRLQMHVHVQNPVTFLILSNTSVHVYYAHI